MKKILLTFVFGILKEKLNSAISISTVGFVKEYRSKLIGSALFIQISTILFSIATFHLISATTTSILNQTFPTPELYIYLSINILVLVANIFLLKSIKMNYRNYLEATNFILPHTTQGFFSPLTKQLKLERLQYESDYQI